MVLESVFSSASKVQVLRVLSSSSSALSPQELEDECTKNISVIYDAVRELEEENVIRAVSPEGRKNYYRLNNENRFSQPVKQLFESEREEYGLSDVPSHLANTLFDARNNLKKKVEGVEMIILFGSVARGDFTPDSDIDLYIVLEEKAVEREDEIYDILEDYDREFSLVTRDVESYRSDFGEEKSDLTKSIMLEGFSILYSSSDELRKVLGPKIGLGHLSERGLAEEKQGIQKLRDFVAELDYEVGNE